jgi:hypothetical protein
MCPKYIDSLEVSTKKGGRGMTQIEGPHKVDNMMMIMIIINHLLDYESK